MYSSLTAFLQEVETLHAAQLEQASHERVVRFSGCVVQACVQGRLTSVSIWIEPSTLSRLVSFGLEVGGGAAISAGIPLKLGYITHLSVDVAAALLERTRQKLSSLCHGPSRSVPAVRDAAHANTVAGELNRIPRPERGLVLGVHRIRRRRR